MHLEKLKRWHWIVLSVVIGFVIGTVRSSLLDEELNSLGENINTQRLFERALLDTVKYPRGVEIPRFQNIRVLRGRDPLDSSKQAYFVCGWYHDPGSPLAMKVRPDGTPEYHTFRYYYIARSPYVPERTVKATAAPGKSLMDRLQSVAEALRIKQPDDKQSVLEYLRVVNAERPYVKLKYEWWKQPRASIAVWVIGCIIGIGGIWPFVVSMVAYGQLFPPREEKGIDLSKVRSSTSSSSSSMPKAKPGMTTAEMDQLRAMEDKLERELKESGMAITGSAPAASGTGPAQPAIRKLDATAPTSSSAVEQSKDDKVFGAKDDDFYPTERHIKKKDE